MPNSANKIGWTAKTLSGGTQTITDYRLVESADDLQNINYSKWTADSQFSPTEGLIHGNYMLGKDITFTSGSTFTPLGYNMEPEKYAAESDQINFNGLNFTISNLTTNNYDSNIGLFSIFSGTVKNLRLKDFMVLDDDNYRNVGALIGFIGNSSDNSSLENKIKNVALLGNNNISGGYSGGLFGSVSYGEYGEYGLSTVGGYASTTFENIETFGDISGNYSGGIVGSKFIGALSIKNAINNANVTAYSSGGILGESGMSYSSDLNNTKNSVSFERVANLGTIAGRGIAGGLLGKSYRGSDALIRITKSWNEGKVSGTSSGSNAGGIVGSLDEPTSAKVDQVFNSTSVSGYDYVGGIFGYWHSSSATGGTLSNAYNTGSVTGASSSSYVGGIVGRWDSGTISNVYNAGAVSAGYYVGGLIGNSYYPSNVMKNAYNLGNVTGGTYIGGIMGHSDESDASFTNVYNANASVTKLIGNGKTPQETNVKNASSSDELDVSDIYKNWALTRTALVQVKHGAFIKMKINPTTLHDNRF